MGATLLVSVMMMMVFCRLFRKGIAGNEELKKKRAGPSSSFRRKPPRLHLAIFIIVVFTVGATILHRMFEVTSEEMKNETNSRMPLLLSAGLREGFGRHMNNYRWEAKFLKSLRFQSLMSITMKQMHGPAFIQDVVMLPDEVLFLVALSSVPKLKQRESLHCSFSHKIYTQLNGIDYLHRSQRTAVVRCQAPPQKIQWSAGSVALVEIIGNQDINDTMTIKADINYSQPIKWGYMVYESFVTARDVVLFAKGINGRQGFNVAAQDLRCIFNNTVETIVTVSAQEVFRCEHPHEKILYNLLGSKITLAIRGRSIPSVAYYEIPPPHHKPVYYSHIETTGPKMRLCACTMVFNVGKYIREWVMYNSHVGVEHFFLYDNNSEDNLEETLESGLSGYNVTRYPWPWPKTQESGFSHCAVMAKDKCQWMMYIDVDEFVFSPFWLKKQLHHKGNQTLKHNKKLKDTSSGVLLNLVMDLISNRKRPTNSPSKIAKIGQISFNCRNFGPSGLMRHPERGVTQGYTCRERHEKRHKSIVLLKSLSPSLLNVVHHFQLMKGYKTLYAKPSKVVINHYKYQAWSEFKTKFRRRVSAYVVDWKQPRNPRSQDRTPGLGYEAIQPPSWEKRFCEVNDSALKEFAFRVFSLSNESDSKLEWQL